MYPDAVEYLPPNSPPPLFNHEEVNFFIDIDNARDKDMQRSKTGIL